MSQDFKNKAVACWYSWQECYILHGVVDSNKNLIIEKENLLKKTSIEVISALLKHESNVWTNYHPPLKRLLSGCIQVNFNGEDFKDLEPLEDLFQCLKSENRLFLNKEIKEANFANHSNCVKLLLMAFTSDLCSTEPDFSGGIATVIPRYSRYDLRSFRAFG